MTFSRFYDLVWRGSVFTCGSCQMNGGNDVFSPRRLHSLSTMRLFIARRSEPNQALVPRLSADAHPLCFDWSAFGSKMKSICPFFGSSLLVSPVFIVYLAGCLCVAAFLSPLILFLFSTFYYQQQKRCKKKKEFVTDTHTHTSILFYLLNDFRQKLLDRLSENSAVTNFYSDKSQIDRNYFFVK